MTWLRSTSLRLALAIGLGFALWIFVSYSENPDRVVQFKDRTVTPEGLAPGLVIVDQNGLPNSSLSPVTITLRADRETLAALGSDDIQAYVNLKDHGPGDHVVPVNVHLTFLGPQPDVVDIAPAYQSIRIDQEITRTVPLTIEVRGRVPFGFESGPVRAIEQGQLVTDVRVRGPQNRVTDVAYARTIADIDRLTANYSSPQRLEAVAGDGRKVEGVQIEPPSVNVLVPIMPSVGIKRVPVIPRVVGNPASGYVVTGLSVEPQFVDLTGSSGPLDSVQSIETQDVDVSRASGTITHTVGLRAPVTTPLLANQPTTVTVIVHIAPIERPFQVTLPVPVQVTDAGAGLLVSFAPQSVHVTLSGSAAALAALDVEKLQATVSVRGLTEGTYVVVPAFTLPQAITLADEPPKVTVTLRSPPPPTPPATPTIPAPESTPTSLSTEAPTLETPGASTLETPENEHTSVPLTPTPGP